MAAPSATQNLGCFLRITRSGPNLSSIISCTSGVMVALPAINTKCTSSMVSSAFLMALSTSRRDRSTRGRISPSYFSRVISTNTSMTNPSSSLSRPASSRSAHFAALRLSLAFWTAFFRATMNFLSEEGSTSCSSRITSTAYSTTAWSKLSPPSHISPSLFRVTNMGPHMSRTEMSNVPAPKS